MLSDKRIISFLRCIMGFHSPQCIHAPIFDPQQPLYIRCIRARSAYMAFCHLGWVTAHKNTYVSPKVTRTLSHAHCVKGLLPDVTLVLGESKTSQTV